MVSGSQPLLDEMFVGTKISLTTVSTTAGFATPSKRRLGIR